MPEVPGTDRARESGRSAIRSSLILPEWLEAGLLGALAVAGVFLLLDAAAGDPLRTPAILGTLLVRGPSSGGSPAASGAAAAYHLVHFVAWIALGLAATRLVRRAEDRPGRRFPLPIGLALYLATLLAAGFALSGTAVGRGPLWLGGLAGLAALVAFLAWRHPGALRRRPPDS